MKNRKKPLHTKDEEEQRWLTKAVQGAPRPLPDGLFPKILEQAVENGYSHEKLLDVLDGWLNFGYCRISDPISNDIDLTDVGEKFFYG